MNKLIMAYVNAGVDLNLTLNTQAELDNFRKVNDILSDISMPEDMFTEDEVLAINAYKDNLRKTVKTEDMSVAQYYMNVVTRSKAMIKGETK